MVIRDEATACSDIEIFGMQPAPKADCPLRPNLHEGMAETVRSGRVRVGEVDAISCTLRFDNAELEQQNTRACVMREAGPDGLDGLVVAISCAAPPEMRQNRVEMRELLEAVGDALATAILQPVAMSEKLVFESLLSSPIDKLRRQGFNVGPTSSPPR